VYSASVWTFDPEFGGGFEEPELAEAVGVVDEEVAEVVLLEELVVVVDKLSFFANCSAASKALTFWKSSGPRE